MKQIKTLNQLFFQALKEKSCYTLAFTLMLLCLYQTGVAQTPIFGGNNGSPTGNIPFTFTNTNTTTNSGSIYIEITDVTLENVYDFWSSKVYEYKRWYNIEVDFRGIDLDDIRKLRFHVFKDGPNDNWSASIAGLCPQAKANIISYNDVIDNKLYDLVEISFPKQECLILSSGAVAIVVDSDNGEDTPGSPSATYRSYDCYDYHRLYDGFAEIINAEVLMKYDQTYSLSGTTFQQDFYVPTCFADDLAADDLYDVNLMLSNLSSNSVDLDVYLRVANPNTSLWWLGNSIDISFNNVDLQNPIFTPSADVSNTSVSVNNNIASLVFLIEGDLTSQEQVFIGKLRFNYFLTPDSNPAPAEGAILATSTFTVQNTTNVSYFGAGVFEEAVIDSYDSEDMSYQYGPFGDTTNPGGTGPSKIGNTETFHLNLQLTPNPASHLVRIEMPNPIGTADLIIYNVNGKKVYENKINNSTINLDVSGFVNGLYMVTIQTDSKQYRSKMLVQDH